MATAAPAAPPQAAPAEGTAVVTGTDIAPAAEPARQVKPIPPRPRLPGVDTDPGDLPSADAAPPSPANGRDPATGRFKAAGDPATPEPSVNTLEPTPARFKIAGEEYDSQDAFEKSFKSLKGTFKPLQAIAKQLGGMDKVVPTLANAAESARAWESHAKTLEAEIASLKSGKTADAPVTSEVTEDGINEQLYAEIRRLAIESGEPWKAQEWLTSETNKILESRMKKMLDERFKPLVEEQEYQAAMDKTGELFGSLAALTNSDGSVAYPELHNPQAAYGVGQVWKRMGLPPEHALTHAGAIAAIGLYRMVNAGATGSQAAVPQAVAQVTGTHLPPAAPTDASAAASLTDGRPTVALAADANVSPEAAAIIAGMRRAGTGQRAALGFEP